MNNKWLKYNISQQTYQPKTVNDVVTNKYDDIHNNMFNRAKEQAFYHYKDDNNSYVFVYINTEGKKEFVNHFEEYKFYEKIKPDALYNEPSYLIATRKIKENKIPRIERYEIDLSPWWNNEHEELINCRLTENITKTPEDWYPYNDIIKYDYINGKATLENKVEMTKRKISFDKISKDDEIKIDYKNTDYGRS